MRPFTSTISIEEARARLSDGIRPITRVEQVPIAQAADRVTAADVAAEGFVPPFSRSAVDGYAVVAADTAGASAANPRLLDLVERIYTGHPPTLPVKPGTCAEIATGAPIPDGADATVMVEDTHVEADGRISITTVVSTGQNVGRRGADISPGDLVVRAGDLLNPSRIGALAAIGRPTVVVYAKPRVAILSTGNEVVEPGSPLGPGQIYDVNRFTINAVVEAHGCVGMPHRAARDTLPDLERALDACAGAEVMVFSGGSSVGERDLVIDLIAKRGRMIFHGIAVKPGKPTAFAIADGVPFFGMPGNPTSCLSNAYILLAPYLRATARLPVYAPRTVRARLGRTIRSQAGRHQFYTIRLHEGVALPAFKGSGEITSLSQADGYIEIASDRSVVEEGTEVDVILF